MIFILKVLWLTRTNTEFVLFYNVSVAWICANGMYCCSFISFLNELIQFHIFHHDINNSQHDRCSYYEAASCVKQTPRIEPVLEKY